MGYGRQYNNYNNYNNQQRNYGGNNNYSQQQQQQQQLQPVQHSMTIEEQIDKRLDIFALILQKAQEKGIDRDTLLMGQGLTAWVTSMLIGK